jgi:hypothetical protein
MYRMAKENDRCSRHRAAFPPHPKENKTIAKQGGNIAGNARKEIEAKTGKQIVSSQNAKGLKGAVKNKKLQ